jgi:hypothetical protein
MVLALGTVLWPWGRDDATRVKSVYAEGQGWKGRDWVSESRWDGTGDAGQS